MAVVKASTSPAGTSQPCSPGMINSGIPATNVLITGLLNAIASMITTGRPSAKLGNTNVRAAKNLVAHLVAADPARDAHHVLKIVARDKGLEFTAHFAIAGQHQLEIRAALQQPPCCIDQQQLSLLFA